MDLYGEDGRLGWGRFLMLLAHLPTEDSAFWRHRHYVENVMPLEGKAAEAAFMSIG